MEEEDYGYGSGDDEHYDRICDDENGEFQEINDESKISKLRPSSCKVIRKESLSDAQKEDLQRAMELLSLKEHHARTLLIHYRWDVDNVFTVFVEKGREQLCLEAGISVVDGSHNSSAHLLRNMSCEICYDEFLADDMTIMECGHCFCNECWTEHFIVKINEGKSRLVTCMAHKCHSICDEGKIRSLLNARDPQLAEKFERFLLESYIEDNDRVKWCPSVPNCGNAIRVENDEYCEVECVCGVQFCFSCLSEAHSPCSCLMWKLWVRKCKDESETVYWITGNTKFCPKCRKPVEKNGGCNMVKCICGKSFCWLCSGATGMEHTWNGIANHECGRFKEEHKLKSKNARQKIWRYMHYYKRYKAHADSLKAEENLKENLQQKTETLESGELAAEDFSWMPNGLFRLTQSRRILLYSYVFAYFMFGDELFKSELTQNDKKIKQRLFEDQQQQLETNIEKLSMFLAEPFAEYPEHRILEIKMKIITLSAVTDDLCEKLYDCIDNELLGPLQQATHIIAPYRSKGVEKASELSASWSTKTEENMEDEGIKC